MGPYFLGLIGIIISWITIHLEHLAALSGFAPFLATAEYSAEAPVVGARTSINISSPSKRAAAIGFLMLLGSVGEGSIGSNIYLNSQAPSYPLGFGFSVGATVPGAVLPATTHNWWLLRWANAKRAVADEGEVEARSSDTDLSEMGEESPFFQYTL